MQAYPREIPVQNGRIVIERAGATSSGAKRANTAREVRIRRYTTDSSFSDLPRPFTGVDIRDQDSNAAYLLTPHGGQLRPAYSEVEGLDRFAQKDSQEESLREIEASKASDLQTEQISYTSSTKYNNLQLERQRDGLTPFEQLKKDFERRSPYKSEVRAGKRIGFYRLILDIGRGNFSKVKLATHTILNAEVAVKVIDRTKFDAKTRRLLSQELANMERLDHPNIIRVFEFHEFPDRWYLIMEYAPVGELHSYLKRHGRMEDTAAKNISAQIVSALKHMHERGVVHRDLKAENVLFVASGIVKVGDFGFSKKINREDALTTFCGSPPYAAPELFVADSYTGPAVDLWALGVLIFYMVAGQLPFRGDSIGKIKRLVLDGQYVVPAYVNQNCKQLINGLLCQSTQKRFDICQTEQCDWFSNQDWFQRSHECNPSPNQISDRQVRDLLRQWWDVDDSELRKALDEGPQNGLTGIYRILQVHGKKFVDGKVPFIPKKSSKKSREKKSLSPNGETVKHKKHHKPSMKQTEEVTTVDLRDKNALKGKMNKAEDEHTSKTCLLL
ncbi:hypothetical protein CRM22_003481 [Opisthorchis felineus]|uniref:non-specific serine/threonine protein kinase n=1 Tax=Opisthorchis felineus TaxID=147828 RepID=A0A4S2M105_OPIFE|nr:hypothetical protein CRM22_003481 [Opisthorchis felineus]TGZ69891.1 hypothetical protein CRM22_003481 [Opisthorchis felineus]